MDAKRSDTLARLLKAGLNSAAMIDGKTGPVFDEEVGKRIGLAGPTLQRYRAGAIPEHGMTKVFAEVCVERGLMGKRWLERFLEASRYPAHEARALIGVLFPEQERRTHTPHARSNLPPPTYIRFVMRHVAYDAVIAGLGSDLSATVIVSLGGMGKTSLARAVAGAYLDRRESFPPIATAVWVSDQARPGATNLSTVLDMVARGLDYPGLAALPHADKLREVEYLLRDQSTLLVVDNAETITDSALLEWLGRLPTPSKALITSRVALPALGGVYTVELRPMDVRESRELVDALIEHSPLRGMRNASLQLMPLADAAGGNPKAIELALGLVQRRSVAEVLVGLSEARLDGLFETLFARAWALLDATTRRVLLAMPLFPASASAEALAYIADLPSGALQRAADQLADLSLLDVERVDLLSPPRYGVHPLVRAFAGARLAESAETDILRERWLAWCADLAASVGFCWDDLDRLDRLDPEHETLQAALEWAVANGRDRETVALAEGVRYYYNVRGLWDGRRLANYERRADAARRLGDSSERVLALAQHTEVLSKQSTLAQALGLLAAAESAADGASLSDDAAFELGHARALLAYASADLATAEGHWRNLLPFSSGLGGQKHVINRRWLATCLLEQGRVNDATALYRASLTDAEACNDTRSVTGNSLKLAAIDLDRGELAGAAAALTSCRTVAERYQDRRRLAECHRLTARLLAARGDLDGAQEAQETAADLFMRMGMRREAEALQAKQAGR